jgi:hypothetical protein
VARGLAGLSLEGWNWEVFPPLPAGAQLSRFQGEADLFSRAGLFGRAVALAAVVWLAIGGCWWWMRRMGWARDRQGLVLVGVCAVWCVCAAVPYSYRVDLARVKLDSAAEGKLREVTGGGRAVMMGAGNRNELLGNGVPMIGGYAALLGERQNKLLALANGAALVSAQYQPNSFAVSPVMRAMGVSSFYSRDADASLALGAAAVASGDVKIWKAPWEGVPLMFSSAAFRPVRGLDEALGAVGEAGAKAGAGEAFVPVVETGAVPRTGAAAGESGVAFERSRATRVTAKDVAGDGVLVWLESLYPGWKAQVNGAAVPIVAAEGAFQAIQLGARAESIVWEYRPASLRIGIFVTLCGAGALALLLMWGYPRWDAVEVLARKERGVEAKKDAGAGQRGAAQAVRVGGKKRARRR